MFIKRPFPCLRKLLPAFDDHKKYIIGCCYVDLIYVLKYASLCAAYKKTAQLLKNPYLTKEERRYMSKK